MHSTCVLKAFEQGRIHIIAISAVLSEGLFHLSSLLQQARGTEHLIYPGHPRNNLKIFDQLTHSL